MVGGAAVYGPGLGPGPPTSVHSFLLREPMEMVRTHLPGACRNVGAAFEDAPRRARQRAAVWAGVVSLFLAGPTFAGGAGPLGLFRTGGTKKAPDPAAASVPRRGE